MALKVQGAIFNFGRGKKKQKKTLRNVANNVKNIPHSYGEDFNFKVEAKISETHHNDKGTTVRGVTLPAIH